MRNDDEQEFDDLLSLVKNTAIRMAGNASKDTEYYNKNERVIHMEKLMISGQNKLYGKVRICGAKNSVLPIIAASILGDRESILEDIPYLSDVSVMCELLNTLGIKTSFSENKTRLLISPNEIINETAPYDLVNKMRASILVMGPMLAKTGITKISMPGGCAIGSRPVDLHLKGFAAMGAEITQDHGFIEAKVSGRLRGSKIYLDFPSVGATENIMMAAVLAEGQTVIENAAIEPEIVDLSMFLTSMGADIKGAGTDTIKITGVNALKGTSHAVIPDRIEAGTYMVAAAITGGDITLMNVLPDHLKPVTAKLREAGVEVFEELNAIRVKGNDGVRAVDIKTHQYPGFPTDMQAQMSALLSRAEGNSMVIETIFENRFMHVSELKRMGASIKVEGRSAVIEGKNKLTGAKVRATDLRAGAALVLAGLFAEGETEISDIYHIDRGYVGLDEKLRQLGADIKRVEEEF
jgi:UDP-N-acetylglucosamine 1-carboxyvinyltransferase